MPWLHWKDSRREPCPDFKWKAFHWPLLFTSALSSEFQHFMGHYLWSIPHFFGAAVFETASTSLWMHLTYVPHWQCSPCWPDPHPRSSGGHAVSGEGLTAKPNNPLSNRLLIFAVAFSLVRLNHRGNKSSSESKICHLIWDVGGNTLTLGKLLSQTMWQSSVCQMVTPDKCPNP